MSKRKQLTEQLIGQFINIKRKLVSDRHQLMPEKSRLTPSQIQILHIVQKKDGLGIKEMAEILGITSSAATQLVDNLANRGLLIRESSQEDRRALKLKLTPDCLAHFQKMRKVGYDRISQLFETLTDEELEQLLHLISKITTQISATKKGN